MCGFLSYVHMWWMGQISATSLLNVSQGESSLKRAEEEAKIKSMPVAGTSRYLATLFLANKTRFFFYKYVICPIIQDRTDIQRMY